MRIRSLLIVGVLTTTCQAQNIGINPTGAAPDNSAMLDVFSSDRGLLLPRVALTATNAAGPVTAPADALLVYNTATAGTAPNNVTPGFYYYETATSTWLPILSGVKGWSTTGNAGTVPGTNFIGTTGAQDLVVKTGGSAAANERFRVLSGGQSVVNKTTVASGDVFSVYANGTTGAISTLGDFAVNGYATTGFGVYGEATTGIGMVGVASPATGSTIGSWGEAFSTNGTGSIGIANTSDGAIPTGTDAIGVQGQVNGTISGTGVAIGVLGILPTTMSTGDARGVQGQSSSDLGIGVLGLASSTSIGGQPIGAYAEVMNATGFGLYATNGNLSGTALLATGQGTSGTYLTAGSGLAGNGETTGIYSYFTTAGAGQGVLIQDAFGAQWNVGYYNGITYRKIVGNGNVSTIVKDVNGNRVLLNCPETPEVLFQDYGIGQLVDGHARIDLDPTLVMNILVNNDHPLKVFIQPEGKCNGLYITNKSKEGFEVHELQDGRSDISFSWSIVATRAGETLTNAQGETRHISYEERFSPAPPIAETNQILSRDVKAVSAEPVQHTRPRR
jgi:hypothetical protein